MVWAPGYTPSRREGTKEALASVGKWIGSVWWVIAHATKSLADVLLMVSEPQHFKAHAKNLWTNIVDIGENIYGIGNGIVSGAWWLTMEVLRGSRDIVSSLVKKIYTPALDREEDTHRLNKWRRWAIWKIWQGADWAINKPVNYLTVDRIDPMFKDLRDLDTKISQPYMRVAA